MKIINICTTLLRLIITIILLILILSSSVVADTNSGNDSQTHQEYVKIWTAEDLNNIRNNYNQSYTLMNDIDLSIYSNWYPIETFNGIFDGNGYTISNLSINRDLKTIGLFGINNGEIKNLVLENPKIVKVVGVDTSTSYVGTIAGKNEGIISNVYVKGHTEVSSPRGYVGGLTGENASDVIDCQVNIGVAGQVAGGLVGHNRKGKIERCSSYSTVKGIQPIGGGIGGLVGRNDACIEHSYSRALLVPDTKYEIEEASGLSSKNTGKLDGCYAAASINNADKASKVRGLAYEVNKFEISKSFYNKDKLVETDKKGGGKGKTEKEMQSLLTYIEEDWDFENTWGIKEKETYPFLLLPYNFLEGNKQCIGTDQEKVTFTVQFKETIPLGFEYNLYYIVLPKESDRPDVIEIYEGQDGKRLDIQTSDMHPLNQQESLICIEEILPVGDYDVYITMGKTDEDFGYYMLTPMKKIDLLIEADEPEGVKEDEQIGGPEEVEEDGQIDGPEEVEEDEQIDESEEVEEDEQIGGPEEVEEDGQIDGPEEVEEDKQIDESEEVEEAEEDEPEDVDEDKLTEDVQDDEMPNEIEDIEEGNLPDEPEEASPTGLTEQEKAQIDGQVLTNFMNKQSLQQVTSDIILPTIGEKHNSTIEWRSSKEKVVLTNGIVVRPSWQMGDVDLILTASVTTGSAIEIYDFDITVKAQPYEQNKNNTESTPKPGQRQELHKKTANDILVNDETKTNRLGIHNINVKNNQWIISIKEKQTPITIQFDYSLVVNLLNEHPELTIELQTPYATCHFPVDIMNKLTAPISNNTLNIHQNLQFQISISQQELQSMNIENFTTQIKNAQSISSWVEISFDIIHKDEIIKHSTSFPSYIKLEVPIEKAETKGHITALQYDQEKGYFEFAPIYVQENSAIIFINTSSVYGVISNSISFIDVIGHWAENCVNEVGSRLIVSGVGEGKFAPDEYVTKEQLITMVTKALGVQPLTLVGSQNIPITREEMASVITEAVHYRKQNNYRYNASDLTQFIDVGLISDRHVNGLLYCISEGIIRGKPGESLNTIRLDPQGVVTRAQAAVVILRALESIQLMS